MDKDFAKLRCTIENLDAVRPAGQREVVLVIAQAFDDAGTIILCEPSIVRSTVGPPDIAVLDPRSGLHVVEVKGLPLSNIRAIKPGGAWNIEYDGRQKSEDPYAKARNKMFDAKNAVERHFGGELNVAFECWVALPRIRRAEWESRFGVLSPSFCGVLFLEDLESSVLGERMRRSGRARLMAVHQERCPAEQFRSLLAAFGDSEVLKPKPRPQTKAPPGSLRERLDCDYAAYRKLSDQQQRLVEQNWTDGPRLVRGVAGSGKTVVLAIQAARLIQRLQQSEQDLFAQNWGKKPVLAVCFNRTLAPFIRSRVEAAYMQRTGTKLTDGWLTVCHFNDVMYHHLGDLIPYRRVSDEPDAGKRARGYLNDLASLPEDVRFRLEREGKFSAIFVDEGQDFHEDEFRVLLRLAGRTNAGLPRMFVFYDDAQNLYGRPRPTWSDLGLEVRGRSVVMDECWRNTRQILEPAFNLLLGTYAGAKQVRTREFADLQTLIDKELVSESGHVRLHFTKREGDSIALSICDNAEAELRAVADRTAELLGREALLPEDLLILTLTRDRAAAIAKAIEAKLGARTVHLSASDVAKDSLAIQPGKVAVSTIASAKGYDAEFVILASANECDENMNPRVGLYVGCTRAREWLDVFAYAQTPLITELEQAQAASCSS